MRGLITYTHGQCCRCANTGQEAIDERPTKVTLSRGKISSMRTCVLTIAVNYGGRWDVAEAARALAAKIASGDLLVADITEQLVAEAMSTAGIPDPDLFIRTGGETRISNFLLWQLAYTELYFTDVLWPDFDEIQLDLALSSFAGRQRRFGRTGEQIL